MISGKGLAFVLDRDIIVQVSENALLLRKDLIKLDFLQLLSKSQQELFELEKQLIPKQEGESVHFFELEIMLDCLRKFHIAAHYHNQYLMLEMDTHYASDGLSFTEKPFVLGNVKHHMPTLDSLALSHPLHVAQYIDQVETYASTFKTLNELVYFILRFLKGLTGFEGSLAVKFDRNFNATVLAEDSEGDFNLYRIMNFNARTRAKLPKEAIDHLMTRLRDSMPCYIIFDRDVKEHHIVPPVKDGPKAIVLKSLGDALLTVEMLKEINSRSLIRLMFNSYNTFWGSISLHSERPFQASILTVTVLNRLARVFSLSIERVKHMQAFEASEALAQQFLSGLKKEEQQTETTERFVTLGCEHGFGRLSLHFCHANTDTLSVLRQVCGKMAKMLDADLFVISIGPEAQVFSNSLVDEELYLRLAKRLKEKRMQEIYSTLYVLDDPMLSLDASFGQILPGLLYIPLYTYLDAFAVFMRSAESDGQDCKEWSRVDLEMVSFVQKLFSWFLEGRLEQEFASKSVERDKGMMMDISHAIRTPMNAVVNFIEVALTENFSKEITTFLEYAYESSHALLAVLEDILSLTLLANKHSLSLRNKPFRLVSVLRSIFSGYQNHPTIKFVPTFTATCEDLILDGDAPKLSQILINLLNNAFKYTVEGQVDCKISHTIQQDRCQLQIQVSDTGIGIPEKHLSHIFEEFERIETTHPLRGQKEGLGLGLSIVYRLVQLMNGSITVQSKEGHGSHFTLLLNFTIREAALPRSPQLQSRAAGPVTVLVAEDNLVNQRVIVKRIEKLGYVPTVTCNGLECYQKYRSDPNKYDVILMDMMMPVMNGMEATEKIRQFERKHKSKRVPIIAVTASITPQDMETYSNVDLDGCFGKPLDFQKLDEFMCSIRKSPIHKLDSKIAIMHQ